MRGRSVLVWSVALAVGALAPTLAASALRSAARGLEFRPVADFGFDAFQTSLTPVLVALFAVALLWEGAGRRPNAIGYAIAAPLMSFAGLEAFFFLAYGASPSASIDAEEGLMLASIAVGAGLFAVIRAADVRARRTPTNRR